MERVHSVFAQNINCPSVNFSPFHQHLRGNQPRNISSRCKTVDFVPKTIYYLLRLSISAGFLNDQLIIHAVNQGRKHVQGTYRE